MTLIRCIKWLTLVLVSFSLCACLGGSIAQQIARSILMKGADSATAAAVTAQENKDKYALQKMPFKGSAPDKYQLAFMTAGFENVSAQIEPLPASSLDDEKPLQIIQEAKLVQVEIWSLLVGDEKQKMLEKARMQGSSSIPPKAEWQQWQVAVGSEDNAPNNQKVITTQTITFLIPPEMGKMHSGAKAVVELSSIGDLNVARYKLN